MTDPDPQPQPNTGQATDDDKRLLGIHADLISALVQIERVMEAKDILKESAVVTRRERRQLTKRARKRNIE